ncbi:hypothetical protein A8C56_10850 [Niabella ginsenosidivorans]|uniref:Uncharacterized protein n=1 Tax=Niabella ginsenosidivorans TaxID=1176587 RepID=A0A1A9I262_9BACT|nr:hypothetical protein A8C56_10850 [Niabella ginsenosidivorans]
MACAVVAEQLQSTLPAAGAGYPEHIERAMISAHAAIKKAGEKDEYKKGMGCSLTCAVIVVGCCMPGMWKTAGCTSLPKTRPSLMSYLKKERSQNRKKKIMK